MLMYIYVQSEMLVTFWFCSLPLQTFVRSECSGLEMFQQREQPFIKTHHPSVPQLTLKPEVKMISRLPVLHCHRKIGQFVDRYHKLKNKKSSAYPTCHLQIKKNVF